MRLKKVKMKRFDLKPGALTAPIPPAIVTVGEGENANMLTVAWTGILATVPPKTYISVRPSRHSYGILKEKGEFVINLPSVQLARKVDYIGIYTGKKVNKFEKCGLTSLPSKKVAPPTVGECPIALECRVTEVLPMGSHDVFLADIVSVSAREELIDSEGKIHFERADLLAYAHGEYYSLGEVVGRFGFSTDKPSDSAKNATRSPKKSEEKPEKTADRTETDKAEASLLHKEQKVGTNDAEAEVKEQKPRPFYERIAKRQAKSSGKNKNKGKGKKK